MSSIANSNNLLEENYSWVDKRLQELYHGYALTMDNWEEFYDADLLTENWAWVDAALEKQCSSDFLPCPAPLSWVRYRSFERQHSIEQRDRAELDIFDYSEEVERAFNNYTYCLATADECESVSSSLDLNSDSDLDLEEGEFYSNYGWY